MVKRFLTMSRPNAERCNRQTNRSTSSTTAFRRRCSISYSMDRTSISTGGNNQASAANVEIVPWRVQSEMRPLSSVFVGLKELHCESVRTNRKSSPPAVFENVMLCALGGNPYPFGPRIAVA